MILDDVLHLLDYIEFGACVTDWNGNIVFWNSGAEHSLGYRPGEIVGLTCPDLISGIAEEVSLLLELKDQQARRMEEGYLPEPFSWRFRNSAGGSKLLRVSPVVVPGLSLRGRLVVYLFGELPAPSYGMPPGPGQRNAPVGVVSHAGTIGLVTVDGSVPGPAPTLREL